MKRLLLLFAAALTLAFSACSGEAPKQIERKAVVGADLSNERFEDQFGNRHAINSDTRSVVMVFSKDKGHEVNKFFAERSPQYMAEHHTQFIADMSGAPSLIRSMFIIPGLKEFKHTVLLITDDTVSAAYKPQGRDEQIMILRLDRGKVTGIVFVDDTMALAEKL